MHYQKVVSDVDHIIKKYARDNDGCYMRHRYDENEKEVYVDNELRKYFEDHNITYDISLEDGLDSPGYAIDFMAVAFEYEGHLYLTTVVFEYM